MRRFIFGKVYNLRFREMGRLILLCLLPCILIGSQTCASAVQSVHVMWNPSNGTNVAGYTIYYGGTSGSYTNQVLLGNVTNTTIPSLMEGAIYFFAARACDNSGLESDLSNESSYAVPTNPPPTL